MCYPRSTRWFASLVVLCLLAGTSAPPRVEPKAPHAAEQLASADGLVPLVSPRRGGALAPELRLTPFVVTPVAPALVPPARTALPAAPALVARLVPLSLPTCSARGPPGDSSTEST